MKNIGFVLLLFSSVATAQIKRGEYCSCKEADKINSLDNFYPDSLYATYKEETAAISVTIVNTTKEVLYIFSSYLQPRFFSSRYLHKIDLNKRRYKFSLLPIIPYVFTKYSDVVDTKDEAIAGNQQIVYDFIKLIPNSSKKIEFKFSDLFKNKDNRDNISNDYDVKLLNKNSTGPMSFCTTSKLSGKYNFSFEFAVYKSVDLLCKQAAYYMQEYEFDKQSKSFKLLTVPVKITKYDYPLLK